MAIVVQEIWHDLGRRLKGLILKRVRNGQHAEDILQDVFYKIHSHIDRLRDEDQLEYWSYRTTYHFNSANTATQPRIANISGPLSHALNGS